MVNITKRLLSLFFGLVLFSVGILLTIHANLGVSPWDAFHLGVVYHSPLTLGQASQLVGLFLIVLGFIMKEKPGWGTIANMYFIGLFIDIIEKRNLIPDGTNYFNGFLLLLAGIFAIGWGSYFYINAGLGTGPRDTLMMALTKKFSTQLWKVRTAIELSVLIIGVILGGPFGIGTLVIALLLGPSVQLAYKIGGKEAADIEHLNIMEGFKKKSLSS